MLSRLVATGRRGQRGSILSALLVIVAFLAILGGALMNELSGQFLLTRTLADRVATQATVNSSVELAISRLQTRSVPTRCSTDSAGSWPLLLNGINANAVATCQAIVPDLVTRTVGGTFGSDGTHVIVGGRDTYLVGDSGGNVFNYAFGRTSPLWSVRLRPGVTGQPAQAPDDGNTGDLMTVVPDGNAVALIDDNVSSGARFLCYMNASGAVSQQPGFENPPAGDSALFPDYAFFGDASGRLYAFDAGTDGTCNQQAVASGIGGPVVGGPLVLSGTVTTQGNGRNQSTTRTAEMFAVVNAAGSSRLVHYSYQEVTDRDGGTQPNIVFVNSVSLPFGTATGAAFSTTIPADRQSISVAITSLGGQVVMATISARQRSSGMQYTLGSGTAVSLGGNIDHAPYWCHCPGKDEIGVGDRNGTLVVLDTSLNQLFRNQGSVAITSRPSADANGDWYYGGSDGFVYDVEPPAAGALMFSAARFGPGGRVGGFPVIGSPGDGCSGKLCMYFGANAGAYLAQIGSVRVMDLSACSTSGAGSTTCVGNPRLWSRVEVGASQFVGGSGVQVLGWSYFNR